MSNSIPVDSAVADAEKSQNTLLNAANELFADTSASSITLPSGPVVEIRAAKVKQIKQLTEFVTEFLQSLDSDALLGMITKISDFQQKQIVAGGEPNQFGSLDKVREIVGNASIISSILTNGMERLPTLVPMFSNLTADEYGELDLDEGFLVAFHILGRNYSFFIQRCAPIVRAFVATLKAQKAKSEKTA